MDTLQEVFNEKVFVIVGNTTERVKTACKIKYGLTRRGYTTYGVGKELHSIDEVPEEIDILVLCVNPQWGLELMQSCRRSLKCVLIQPGAESPELIEYLEEQNIPYLESCLLAGFKLYPMD